MKFLILRDSFLRTLYNITTIVERERQHTRPLPILANILLEANSKWLMITVSSIEISLTFRLPIIAVEQSGGITIPAHKLIKICRSLPSGALIQFEIIGKSAILSSGRSRLTLATLPANEFEFTSLKFEKVTTFDIMSCSFKKLIKSTSFSMAKHDVRDYLNGMLWELKTFNLRLTATDGHRLATVESKVCNCNLKEYAKIILPRNSVLELQKFLYEIVEDLLIHIVIGKNHLHVNTNGYFLTYKLIDGKFPDYERFLNQQFELIFVANREDLIKVIRRTTISDSKIFGVRLSFNKNFLKVSASIHSGGKLIENAEDCIQGTYNSNSNVRNLDIGFNAKYLIDVLNVLETNDVKIKICNKNSACFINPENSAYYVIMPLRLIRC